MNDPADSLTRRCEVVNRLGLHARAAARMVECANAFAADIEVWHNTDQANAKSIMGLMLLAAGKGSHLTLRATGTDASAALQALAQLMAERFGEAD